MTNAREEEAKSAGPDAAPGSVRAREHAGRGTNQDDESRADREPPFEEEEPFHPAAIGLALAMVLALVLGAWIIFEQARCNPLYSDSALPHSQACR